MNCKLDQLMIKTRGNYTFNLCVLVKWCRRQRSACLPFLYPGHAVLLKPLDKSNMFPAALGVHFIFINGNSQTHMHAWRAYTHTCKATR